MFELIALDSCSLASHVSQEHMPLTIRSCDSKGETWKVSSLLSFLARHGRDQYGQCCTIALSWRLYVFLVLLIEQEHANGILRD